MPTHAIRWSRVLSVIFAFVVCAAALLAPSDARSGPKGAIVNSFASSDRTGYLDLNGFHFDPLVGLPELPDALRNPDASSDESSFYILQLHPPITQEAKAELVAAGVSILGYVSSNAFVVKADPTSIARVRELPQVRWVGAFEPAFKLSPRLSQFDPEDPLLADTAAARDGAPPLAWSTSLQGEASGVSGYSATDSLTNSRIRVTVLSFEKSGVLRVAGDAAALGATDILWSTSSSGVVRAEIGRDALIPLARNPDVMWIDREIRPHTFNDIARWVIQSGNGTTFATPVHAHGIFGTGQLVTVGDTGLDYQHNAFEDPLHPGPGPSQGHGLLRAFGRARGFIGQRDQPRHPRRGDRRRGRWHVARLRWRCDRLERDGGTSRRPSVRCEGPSAGSLDGRADDQSSVGLARHVPGGGGPHLLDSHEQLGLVLQRLHLGGGPDGRLRLDPSGLRRPVRGRELRPEPLDDQPVRGREERPRDRREPERSEPRPDGHLQPPRAHGRRSVEARRPRARRLHLVRTRLRSRRTVRRLRAIQRDEHGDADRRGRGRAPPAILHGWVVPHRDEARHGRIHPVGGAREGDVDQRRDRDQRDRGVRQRRESLPELQSGVGSHPPRRRLVLPGRRPRALARRPPRRRADRRLGEVSA